MQKIKSSEKSLSKDHPKKNKRKKDNHFWRKFLLIIAGLFLLGFGSAMIWVSTLNLPDFSAFDELKLQSSTKIYDRTGTILLYNANQNFRRTIIPYEDMGLTIKQATVAIEDDKFYQHHGIRPASIIRALLANITTGSFSQGGSTITQQIIKNTLLTREKTISRKVKEWILAIKAENIFSKDEILGIYLNQASYGGNIYGVEEASQIYFHKPSRELDNAEAAYLASIPRGPSLYSPYGSNRKSLEDRKNLVLSRMHILGMLNDGDYESAKNEIVTFAPAGQGKIKAPHFVFFVLDYLKTKYGQEAVDNSGLKVITTLDYDLEQKTETIVNTYSKAQEKSFNGSNGAAVIIDPKTGQVLTMVGSRDYFDKEIDGAFNVATAHRQPGSSFKPIVYSTAFSMGYTPETILYDVETQFNSSCEGLSKTSKCYVPSDYNDKWRGPMTLRNALQQSINIPAVKLLYLVGIKTALQTAKNLGINNLGDGSQYGLSLVLGGAEVSPLDLTSAYSVFANEGVRRPYKFILSVTDANNNSLEEYQNEEYRVLPQQAVLTLDDVLTDNNARIPTFGANSPLYFADRPVAAKTGTTNDNKDVWTMGYTPSIVVGVWVGNNNNKPMRRITAGPSAAIMWHAIMAEALKTVPLESFPKPEPVLNQAELKPVMRGDWQAAGPHSILQSVDPSNPLGPAPVNPAKDSQYFHWEESARKWWLDNGYSIAPQFPQAPTEINPNNPPVNPFNNGSVFPVFPLPIIN